MLYLSPFLIFARTDVDTKRLPQSQLVRHELLSVACAFFQQERDW